MKSVWQRGFTLIELMVVIVIVAILAGIGYPMYTQQVDRGRRVDGRAAAMMVALAQERFFTSSNPNTFTVNLADPDLRLSTQLQAGRSESNNYTVAVAPGPGGIATSFIVTATSTAGDTECATLTVDQTGARDGTGTDPTVCW